jgi:cell division protein FtsL
MTEEQPVKHRRRRKKSLRRRIKGNLERFVGQDKMLYIFLAVILAVVAGIVVLFKYK